MTKQIQDALAQLDPNNNDQWTADGLPRLDTVKQLTGDAALTREQISKAVPGFNRAIAAKPAETPTAQNSVQATQPAQESQPTGSTEITQPASATQAVGPIPQPAEPAATQSGGDNGEMDPEGESQGAGDEQDEVSELEAELAIAQARLAQIKQAKIQVLRAEDEATKEVDAIVASLEQIRGKETTGDAIRGYLGRQQLELKRRAAHNEHIRKSGIDLKALLPQVAPIDAVMARKTKRGANRPVYNPSKV